MKTEQITTEQKRVIVISLFLLKHLPTIKMSEIGTTTPHINDFLVIINILNQLESWTGL